MLNPPILATIQAKMANTFHDFLTLCMADMLLIMASLPLLP